MIIGVLSKLIDQIEGKISHLKLKIKSDQIDSQPLARLNYAALRNASRDWKNLGAK